MDKLKKVTQDIKRHLHSFLMPRQAELKDLDSWILKNFSIKAKLTPQTNKMWFLKKKWQHHQGFTDQIKTSKKIHSVEAQLHHQFQQKISY